MKDLPPAPATPNPPTEIRRPKLAPSLLLDIEKVLDSQDLDTDALYIGIKADDSAARLAAFHQTEDGRFTFGGWVESDWNGNIGFGVEAVYKFKRKR